MPMTRIAMRRGRSVEFRTQVSRILQETLEATFDVPSGDCFQLFDEYEPDRFIYDCEYLSGGRSEHFMQFHITAGRPRTEAQKHALYQMLCQRLHKETGLNPDDLMVIIRFTAPEDWSFSQGKMNALEGIQ